MNLNITKHKSGLTILTYKMRDIRSVSMHLIVTVGSRFETEEESGISHFLEHMAFKGTETRTAKQIAEQFDSIGGMINACTSKERTMYYAKTLSEHMPIALEIIADIVQNSLYQEGDIEKEYNVICQEIALSADDPDDIAHDNLYATAFKKQALGMPILGSKESISKFNTQSFRDYIKSHYHSGNMFLSIAGDVDHDEVIKLVDKIFDIKSNTRISPEPAQYSGGKIIAAKSSLEHGAIMIGFPSVSYLQKEEFYHSQILSLILGGGMSSRLFQKIREELSMSYSVGSYNSAHSDVGLFTLYAATEHDNLAKVQKILLEEALKITDKVSEEELIRAKAQIKANLIMAEEKVAYKSEEIGRTYSLFGCYEGIDKVMEYVNNTTTKNIVDIARAIFSKESTLSVVTDRKDRSL